MKLLEYPIPTPPTATAPSVTKTVTWRYLGNQAWYHRFAGVKTTGKILNKKRENKVSSMVKKMVKNGKNGSKWSKWSKKVQNGPK